MKKTGLLILMLCFAYFTHCQEYKVTATSLNLRAMPSENADIISKIAKGSTVDFVEATDENWIKVQYNGKVGFVSSNYIVEKETTDDEFNGRFKVGLYVYLGIIILGIILGMTRVITVYKDFSDLTITFLLTAIPYASFFFIDQIKENNFYNIYLASIIIYGTLMTLWIFYRTMQSNSNLFAVIISVLVKIPLAIIFWFFLSMILFPNKSKTKAEQLQDRLNGLLGFLFLLRLVETKVWRARIK